MINFSPCKINIGLEITAKRPDGYHQIESVLYPVPLMDVIEIVRSTSTFDYAQSGLMVEGKLESNLLYKAWKLVDENFGIGGIKLHLHKQIPMGAGLGGGSSNAATLLKMLNQYYGLNQSNTQLHHLAEKLGSDCPFFINNTAVFASQTGTELQSIDLDLANSFIVIVKAAVSVSTAQAYSGVKVQAAQFNLRELPTLDKEKWTSLVFNRFEPYVFQLHPELPLIKETLIKAGAIYASMSGSGSAIYGIFKDEPQAISFDPNYFVWKGKLQ
jgi:4-diphosphocytidyl-2-C-methyl-D-erythritol kinase